MKRYTIIGRMSQGRGTLIELASVDEHPETIAKAFRAKMTSKGNGYAYYDVSVRDNVPEVDRLD